MWINVSTKNLKHKKDKKMTAAEEARAIFKNNITLDKDCPEEVLVQIPSELIPGIISENAKIHMGPISIQAYIAYLFYYHYYKDLAMRLRSAELTCSMLSIVLGLLAIIFGCYIVGAILCVLGIILNIPPDAQDIMLRRAWKKLIAGEFNLENASKKTLRLFLPIKCGKKKLLCGLTLATIVRRSLQTSCKVEEEEDDDETDEETENQDTVESTIPSNEGV